MFTVPKWTYQQGMQTRRFPIKRHFIRMLLIDYRNWRRGNDFRGDVEERRGGRRDYEDRRGGFEGRGGFGAEGRERRGFGGGFGSRGEGEVFDRSMFGSRQPEGETGESHYSVALE